MKTTLSVIIPCFNEEKNIKRGVLTEVSEYLNKQKYTWEVLICDDGSSDNSRDLVKKEIKDKKHFKLLALPHGGKPAAIFGGVKEAVGDILLFADMDQSTPLSELKKLLPYFNQGYDVVIGSRGLHRQNFSMLRKIASVVFRFLRGAFVLPQIIDTQCGFKTIKSSLAKEIFPRLSYFKTNKSRQGWSVSAYDSEMLFIADKWGHKIKEVPVVWQDEDTSNTKNRSLSKFVNQSMKMAKEVINIVTSNRDGDYDKK